MISELSDQSQDRCDGLGISIVNRPNIQETLFVRNNKIITSVHLQYQFSPVGHWLIEEVYSKYLVNFGR